MLKELYDGYLYDGFNQISNFSYCELISANCYDTKENNKFTTFHNFFKQEISLNHYFSIPERPD